MRDDEPRPVLVVSADPTERAWVERCLGGEHEVVAVGGGELDARARDAALVVLGAGEADAAPSAAQLPTATPCVVLGDPSRTRSAPWMSHVLPSALAPEAAGALLRSLMRTPASPPQPRAVDAADVRRRARVFLAARGVAAATALDTAETAAAAGLAELTGADRARCVLFDSATGDLWSEAHRRRGEADDGKADRGLVGWAALTGQALRSGRAGADPRWLPWADEPAGQGDERVLIQPAVGVGGEVQAVLVAVRAADRPEFAAGAARAAESFAALVGPMLEQLAEHVQTAREQADPFFRPAAVQAYCDRRYGDVVRALPAWSRWAYTGLVAALVGAVWLVATAQLHRYASGPAVVRPTDPHASGSFELVAVLPADQRLRIRPGQPLRLELAGFPRAYQDLVVARVSPDLIPPSRARDLLGIAGAEAALAGSAVVVRARLPAGFRAEGAIYPYVEGLSGTARIQVGTRDLIDALLFRTGR